MATESDIVTAQFIADLCGCSRSHVSKLLKDAGFIADDGVPLKDGVRIVVEDYRKKSDKSSLNFAQAKTRKTEAEAQKAEIELEEMRGNKIDVSDAREAIQKILMVFTKELDRLPTEVGQAVVGAPSQDQAKRIIEKHVRRVREELSSDNTLGKLK